MARMRRKENKGEERTGSKLRQGRKGLLGKKRKRQRGKDGEESMRRKGLTSISGARIARTARMASKIFINYIFDFKF